MNREWRTALAIPAIAALLLVRALLARLLLAG
jgi:hypothetical protein